MCELSIILASINDSIATNFTAAQIINQLERAQISYEIIIVDNGDDPTHRLNLEAFLDFHQDFPIRLETITTRGSIPPNAYGVSLAKGQYVAMPEPHMVFSPNFYRDLLTFVKRKPGTTMVFGTFAVGRISKLNDEFWSGSQYIGLNPWGKTNTVTSHETDRPFKIMAGGIGTCLCTRDWLLKIGNMFPEAFAVAGGFTAEHLMLGLTTWMFGGSCWSVPKAYSHHFVYANDKPTGRHAATYSSMAVGAYILGGEQYLAEMPTYYGEYTPGELETIPLLAKTARAYVLANSVISLPALEEKWKTSGF